MEFWICEELINDDLITRQTFWIGAYPGLSNEAIESVGKTITDFVKSRG
jgi:CDP-6-deoxy-D-xylo-4-hexulose-3-dehydrase